MTATRKTLEKELDKLFENNQNNFAKILAHAKKNFDEWCLSNLSRAGYPDMKVGYMAFLMNISSAGITNNDLAKKIRVTKQAMSKTSKELQALGLIELTPNPDDARSAFIHLTTHGLKMVIHARHRVEKLTEKYVEAVGHKKYLDMLDTMNTIISIHHTMRDKQE